MSISKRWILSLGSLVWVASATVASAQDPRGGFSSLFLTLDDRLAHVAERAPAFGGFYVDEATGSIKVYSWNLTAAGATEAEQALRAVLGQDLPQGKIEIVRGNYSFRELKLWHDRMTELLAMRGVVLTDIDDRTNRLLVGVETERVSWAVRDRLGALGIPGESVDLVEMAPIKYLNSLRDRHRPLVGGLHISFISAGSQYMCTMGFNAVRSGINGVVTNSHCTATPGGVQNTIEYQPNVSSSNRLGVETVDPPYLSGGPCPVGLYCRYSDSAFIRRDSTVSGTRGRIARPGIGSYAWNSANTFRIVGKGDALVGQTVAKVGRTTGRTQGVVKLTCANAVIGNRGFFCQTMTNLVAGPGDSGSPIFRITNSPAANDVRLSGILFGGNSTYTFISPISGVQRSIYPAELGSLGVCATGFNC